MTDAFWHDAFIFLGAVVVGLPGIIAACYAAKSNTSAKEAKVEATAAKMQSKANSTQMDEIHDKVNGGLEKAVREARKQRDPQVLLIDDDANDLLLARVPLEAYGCDVMQCKSLEVSKALILSRIGSPRGLPFDFILLDLKIPGSDTKEFLELFDEIAPKVPVVILTGYPNDPRLKEVLNVPRMWLTKPLTEHAVKSLLEYLQIPYYKHPDPRS